MLAMRSATMQREIVLTVSQPHIQGPRSVIASSSTAPETIREMPGSPQAATLLALREVATAAWLSRHHLCPVSAGAEESDVRILVSSQTDVSDVDELALAVGRPLITESVSPDVLERAIENFRRAGESRADTETLEDPADSSDADARGLASQPPVVRYFNLLVREAVALRASDIHLEASRQGLTARFRIDGVLSDGPAAPPGMHNAVVSRCKLLAGLDIAERRKPQDGRIRIRLDERELDLRVSSVPTLHGESVVVRLLDRGDRPVALSELGMPALILDRALDAISRPHGMVLVTGPTGSGKTTTLYAALAQRSAGTEKLITVEDPIEYQIPRVTQVPVHQGAGVSFASALRAILRQDPDVVLIGELRDEETAGVAVQAAMTGHLVLATLHTNDALSAFARLVDLSVPPYLLVDTVSAVIAQRLVRCVCLACANDAPLTQDDIVWLEGLGDDPRSGRFVRGRGCQECRGTGYRGRVGIFECVTMSEPLRAAITSGTSRDELLRVAVDAGGFVNLAEDGLAKARAGLTTLEEVRRVAVA
jgi:general secretion pathway protein E